MRLERDYRDSEMILIHMSDPDEIHSFKKIVAGYSNPYLARTNGISNEESSQSDENNEKDYMFYLAKLTSKTLGPVSVQSSINLRTNKTQAIGLYKIFTNYKQTIDNDIRSKAMEDKLDLMSIEEQSRLGGYCLMLADTIAVYFKKESPDYLYYFD